MAGAINLDISFGVSVRGPQGAGAEPVQMHVRKLEQFPVEFAANLRAAIEQIFKLAEGVAKRETYRSSGLKVRTARLWRGVGTATEGIAEVVARRAGADVKIDGLFGSQVPYWPTQEFGATIQARNAALLHFPILAAGGGRAIVGWARAQRVTIPARPFVWQALEKTVQQWGDAVFDRLIDQAAAKAVA